MQAGNASDWSCEVTGCKGFHREQVSKGDRDQPEALASPYFFFLNQPEASKKRTRVLHAFGPFGNMFAAWAGSKVPGMKPLCMDFGLPGPVPV